MPHPLGQECSGTWGTFGMFVVDESYRVKQPTSQYYAAQLLTQEWMKPGDDIHRVFPVASEVKDEKGRLAVTAYAVKRPDGEWSLLAINKDPKRTRSVGISFHDEETGRDLAFQGELRRSTFAAENYAWHEKGADGYAKPNTPPKVTKLAASATSRYTLPRASVTVLRGKIQ